MTPETVVEHVQETAAIEAAVIVADGVRNDVLAVEGQLEQIAEQNEETHQQISEGETWHAEELQSLETHLTSQLAEVKTTLASVLMSIAELATALANLKLSLDSRPTTPATPAPAPTPEAVEIVDPVTPLDAEVESPVPETPRKRFRKL